MNLKSKVVRQITKSLLICAVVLTLGWQASAQSYRDYILVAAPNGGDSGKVYVMFGGQKHWVAGPAIFNGLGYDWGKIKQIPLTSLNSIPTGAAIEFVDTQYAIPVTATQQNNIEGGTMKTTVTLRRTGKLVGVTNTWTKVLLKGFTGGLQVILYDEYGPVWITPNWRTWGVDGTCCGRSDRTETWQNDVPPDIAKTVTRIAIIQNHTPRVSAQKVADQAGKLYRANMQDIKDLGNIAVKLAPLLVQ